MLWNVYVVEDGACIKLNSEPYDPEQLALALTALATIQPIMLVPTSSPDAEPDNCFRVREQTHKR